MHPLEAVINAPEPLVLIGNSAEDRFPAYSYDNYTRIGKRFYCLDIGGLSASRGDLAVIWVRPRTAQRAVDLAHEAGCRRVWFSFGSGHPDAVERAKELGMQVVEIGRCPVLYLADKRPVCKAHARMTKLTGLYGQPPRTEPDIKRRESL
jgi:hypothetical protein